MAIAALAIAVRLAWILAVPTVPVSDFAMYRESANYLSEFGQLDPGFIYMPGFVVLLAWIKGAGGGLIAATAPRHADVSFDELRCRHCRASMPPGVTLEQFAM